MIVELAGLPGAGKTTLAKDLAAAGGVLPPPIRLLEALMGGLMYMALRPVASVRLMRALLRGPRGMRYSLVMNGFFVYGAQYLRARHISEKGKVAILDQGHYQLIVSLGEGERLLPLLPKPDVLVVVEAPREVREARMEARGRRPRVEFGVEAAERFEQKGSEALTEAIPHITDVAIRRYDGASHSPVRARELFETLPSPVPKAPLIKVFSYGFASAVRSVDRLFNHSPEVAVLMYHAVDQSGWKLAIDPERFTRQVAYVKAHANVVALQDVVAHAKGEKVLPHPSVALTFDDGYRDLITTVLPIIAKYRVPITVFLPTDLEAQTGERGKRPICTWDELATLKASGLVSIESHSRTHAHLPRLAHEELSHELAGSADDIERHLGERPKYHAYPYGDRSLQVEEASRQVYEAAFGITEGLIHKGDNLFRLKRVQVDRTMSSYLFALRLTGAVEWHRRIVGAVRNSL
jgi:peptidoglycan/xylan/chitin deacetylase (PgdA/CDA1 family)/adenylate kinase